MPTPEETVANVAAIAAVWRTERAERQARRHLERADFDALREAGFLALVVPSSAGGTWVDAATSGRVVCECLRVLAGADPSVALVSAMHPSVVGFWLSTPDAAGDDAWRAQRASVFASAAAGEQWATITSEPGSGGDIARTKATARAAGDGFLVSGDKHFGSGSGIADHMITTAVAEGETAPSMFVLAARDQPWDGSTGWQLLAEWDGVGMSATQSHAMRLRDAPGFRLAFDGPIETITLAAGPFIASLFTAVVVGVLEEAVGLARAQLGPKADSLRAYEKVEWARAEQDAWVAVQAYEGALRAIESGDAVAAGRGALRAKEAVADLAESSLLRICRVVGGGSFSARSPFAHWFEDVRALGFLRPPWGLAYDLLYLTSFL